MRTVIVFLLMAVMVRADVWVESTAGFFVMSEGSDGVPYLTPAPNVTEIVRTGIAPDDPDDPDDPPPTDDQWGLVALSEREAKKVNDPATAAKLSGTYQAIGRLVQEGKITQEQLPSVLTASYKLAVGTEAAKWQGWRDATQDAYNAAPLNNAKDAGQGDIDIGIGAGRASALSQEQIEAAMATTLTVVTALATEKAIGDGTFIKFFIEVLLPLLLKLLELFGGDSALAVAMLGAGGST